MNKNVKYYNKAYRSVQNATEESKATLAKINDHIRKINNDCTILSEKTDWSKKKYLSNSLDHLASSMDTNLNRIEAHVD